MKKLAIVTGGTRGIGKAISLELAAENYFVIATYYSNSQEANEFSKSTGIETLQFDVSDHNQTKEKISQLLNRLDIPVSVLVNNAGISKDGMLHKLSNNSWLDVINVNLNSCYNVCKAVLSSMRDNNYGRIINISSINAQSGRIGVTNYSAAKAGILGFTRALAMETAMKGITVNAIAPGYVATDLIKDVPKNVLEKIIDEIPLKRLGKPEEIAKLVKFLASEDSGYITGETISINGGHHMQ